MKHQSKLALDRRISTCYSYCHVSADDSVKHYFDFVEDLSAHLLFIFNEIIVFDK